MQCIRNHGNAVLRLTIGEAESNPFPLNFRRTGNFMPNPHVLMFINCSLSPSPEALVHYFQAQQKAQKEGIDSTFSIMKMTASPYLAINSVCHTLLAEPKFTHLMITSDDTVCDDDLIIKLVNDDKDIVSGVYRTRDAMTNGLAVYGLPGENFDEWMKAGALVERKYSNSQSMTIKREVIEKVVEAHPELDFLSETGETVHGIWMPYIKDKRIYCDDWAFCQRATDLGFKCWIDFNVKLAHKCDIWLGC